VGKTHFINSKTSSGTASRIRSADDMTRGPMAPDLSRVTMPKNILTQIHWFSFDRKVQTTLSATVVTEFNQSFALSDHAAFSSAIATLFDQYALFAVYCKISASSTQASTANASLYTAIDYDNVSNLGTVTAISAFSTVVESGLGFVQERYIEPCNASPVYNGSVFTNFGQTRVWLNSSNLNTPHYALRVIAEALGTAGTGALTVETSYVICARNSF